MDQFFINNKNEKIYYKVWDTEKPKAMLQIAHGMAEHIERYDEFGEFMNENGILVFGNNHRGHGPYSNEILGFFGEKDGWDNVLDDMNILNELMTNKYPDIPKFILGHSMGSFLTRYFIPRYGNDFSGFILVGSAFSGGINERLFRLLAKINKFLKGPENKSSFLNNLFNKTLSSMLEDPITEYDWINSLSSEVNIYLEDDYCGFPVTNQFFIDLLTAIININTEENIKNIPNIPILIISGDRDPVGKNGWDLLKLDNLYRENNLDSHLILYNDMRHEILRERVKFKVYEDVLNFINTAISKEKTEI